MALSDYRSSNWNLSSQQNPWQSYTGPVATTNPVDPADWGYDVPPVVSPPVENVSAPTPSVDYTQSPYWQDFYDFAMSMGLDPSQFAVDDLTNLPSTLPSEWYANMGQYVPGQQPSITSEQVRQDLIMDPSYQFRFGEGQRAMERRAAAMGKRFSGQTLAELERYGQDYATTEYANAYNRLAGLTGTGQTATSNINQLAGGVGSSLANLYSGMGASQASGLLASGAYGAQQTANLGSLWSQAASNFMQSPTGQSWF